MQPMMQRQWGIDALVPNHQLFVVQFFALGFAVLTWLRCRRIYFRDCGLLRIDENTGRQRRLLNSWSEIVEER